MKGQVRSHERLDLCPQGQRPACSGEGTSKVCPIKCAVRECSVAVSECAVRTAHSQESDIENVPFQRHILNGTFYRTDLWRLSPLSNMAG